jgi:hypothetical protein
MPGRLTANFPMLDGVPAAGTVEIEPVDAATLRPIAEIIDAAGNQIFSGRVAPPLDESGALDVELPAADDDVNPTGFAYLVTPLLEHINLDPVLVVILDGLTVPLAEAVTPPAVAPEYAELVGQAAAAAQRAEDAAGGSVVASATEPADYDVWFQLDPDTGELLDIRTP